MKSSCVVILALLLLSAALSRGAGLTELKAAVILSDVGSHSTPTVADWDNNGKNDLISGRYNSSDDGRIMLYLNQGSNADPSFSTSSYLQAGGSDIRLSAY